jgi:dihydrolipoamide dehydrogenase
VGVLRFVIVLALLAAAGWAAWPWLAPVAQAYGRTLPALPELPLTEAGRLFVVGGLGLAALLAAVAPRPKAKHRARRRPADFSLAEIDPHYPHLGPVKAEPVPPAPQPRLDSPPRMQIPTEPALLPPALASEPTERQTTMADQSGSYDVVIIGGGPGGYNAAIRAGQLGLSVACVEMRGTLGGTCLNVGCIPSKALLHASELYEAAGKDFASMGIEASGVKLNLARMMANKAEGVTALTKGIEFLFKKNKATWIKGRGRVAAPGVVEVTAADGTKSTLQAKNIVIATGSEPTPLPGVAFDGRRVVDSTGALDLPETPKHLVVVGAGIIGLELGSVWRRLGAQVTVVEYLDRITPGMDSELAAAFQRTLTKQGMTFKLGAKVTGAAATDRGVTLTVEPSKGGAAEEIKADVVLVAIGRRPYTQDLGLETVGVQTDARGFIPTDRFRTSAPGVWAIGDVILGPMLAHKAEDDAVACIETIAGRAGHVDYDLVPSVVYTYPEVAWVGKTEDELKAAGVGYRVGKFPFTANSRAKINHETDGLVKFLADAESDKVLGVHMMGPQVGEMIAEACVLMAFGGSSEDLARVCHPHPTRSEAVRQAAMGVEGWTMQA